MDVNSEINKVHENFARISNNVENKRNKKILLKDTEIKEEKEILDSTEIKNNQLHEVGKNLEG